MRSLATATLLVALACPALAAPDAYALDTENSVVGFGYQFSGQTMQGTMPVATADITLDLDAPANSSVSATLNAAEAQAGVFLATQAMRGTSVLDTKAFPTIRFTSTKITPKGDAARVDGMLTIRDVTRPVSLTARIYRQRGTEEGDRSRLSIHLAGAVSRAAFGADGFPDLVADTITLDILTRIDRSP